MRKGVGSLGAPGDPVAVVKEERSAKNWRTKNGTREGDGVGTSSTMPRTRTKEELKMIDLRREVLQEEEGEAVPIVIEEDDDEDDWTEEEMQILLACDS